MLLLAGPLWALLKTKQFVLYKSSEWAVLIPHTPLYNHILAQTQNLTSPSVWCNLLRAPCYIFAPNYCMVSAGLSSHAPKLFLCWFANEKEVTSWKYQNVMVSSVARRTFKTHVSSSCCPVHGFALSLYLEVSFLHRNSVWLVVKLGSPSSIGRSYAEVALPFSDPPPSLQVLSNIIGSSPAVGLAVINEQMACSPFSDLVKHIPFTFFLHGFELFFYHAGRVELAADAALVNTGEWAEAAALLSLLLISTRVVGRGC